MVRVSLAVVVLGDLPLEKGFIPTLMAVTIAPMIIDNSLLRGVQSATEQLPQAKAFFRSHYLLAPRVVRNQPRLHSAVVAFPVRIVRRPLEPENRSTPKAASTTAKRTSLIYLPKNASVAKSPSRGSLSKSREKITTKNASNVASVAQCSAVGNIFLPKMARPFFVKRTFSNLKHQNVHSVIKQLPQGKVCFHFPFLQGQVVVPG